jgi:hypothetical protein
VFEVLGSLLVATSLVGLVRLCTAPVPDTVRNVFAIALTLTMGLDLLCQRRLPQVAGILRVVFLADLLAYAVAFDLWLMGGVALAGLGVTLLAAVRRCT